MKKINSSPAILGAAFLMATSAIGPGFLTQTTVFTQQLLASFGFVILISIVLDVGAQLNIWRILAISKLRAPELANRIFPGLGHLLALLIVFGGLAFNIANVGGSGLGLNALLNIPVETGALVSTLMALVIFWIKEFGKILDQFSKALGLLMILLTGYIAIRAQPDLSEVIHKTFVPDRIDFKSIVTLVGGTVGGYISFAGAHRLIDAGVTGNENLPQINRSAVSGIVITGIMRFILFLAVLGVVSYASLNPENPAASVFQTAAGNIGYKIFGLVLWCAAITSIIGCAYTSVSFLKSFHPAIEKNQVTVISFFIVVSSVVFITIGNPVRLLVLAGAINGFILPLSLGIILIASNKKELLHAYQHPLWMKIAGWVVVLAVGLMSFSLLRNFF